MNRKVIIRIALALSLIVMFPAYTKAVSTRLVNVTNIDSYRYVEDEILNNRIAVRSEKEIIKVNMKHGYYLIIEGESRASEYEVYSDSSCTESIVNRTSERNNIYIDKDRAIYIKAYSMVDGVSAHIGLLTVIKHEQYNKITEYSTVEKCTKTNNKEIFSVDLFMNDNESKSKTSKINITKSGTLIVNGYANTDKEFKVVLYRDKGCNKMIAKSYCVNENSDEEQSIVTQVKKGEYFIRIERKDSGKSSANPKEVRTAVGFVENIIVSKPTIKIYKSGTKKISGTSSVGSTVYVSVRGSVKKTTTDKNGSWEIYLKSKLRVGEVIKAYAKIKNCSSSLSKVRVR